MPSCASSLWLALKRLLACCLEELTRARQLRSAPRVIHTSLQKKSMGGDLRPRTLRDMFNGFFSVSSLDDDDDDADDDDDDDDERERQRHETESVPMNQQQ